MQTLANCFNRNFIKAAVNSNVRNINDMKNKSEAYAEFHNIFDRLAATADDKMLQKAMYMYNTGSWFDTSGLGSVEKKSMQDFLHQFVGKLRDGYGTSGAKSGIKKEMEDIFVKLQQDIYKENSTAGRNLVRSMAKGSIFTLIDSSKYNVKAITSKVEFEKEFMTTLTDSEWARMKVGHSMLSGKEPYGQMKAGGGYLGMVINTILNSTTAYILSTGVVNYMQSIHNGFLQATSLTTDLVARSKEQMNGELIGQIRQESGILKTPGVPAMKSGPMAYFNPQELMRLGEVVMQGGIYQIGDYINTQRLENWATNKAILDVGYQPQEFLDLIKKGGTQAEKATTTVGRIAEEYLTEFGYMEAKRNNSHILFQGEGKRAARNLFMFMSSFGLNSLKKSLYAVTDLVTGNHKQKRAIELYVKKGDKYAGTALMEYYTYNEPLMHFIHKSMLALHYAYNLERTEGNDKSVMDEATQVYDMSKIFNSGLAGPESNSITRVLGMMWKGIAFDVSENGIVPGGKDFAAGMALGAEQLLKELSRKALVGKALTATVSAMNAGDLSPTEAFIRFKNEFIEAGAGYGSFLANGQKRFGYTFDSPKINKSNIDYIVPFFDEDKKKFNSLSTQNRIKLLTELPKESFVKWMMYYTPFFKDWNMGQFSDNDMDSLLFDAKDDLEVQNMYKGELPLYSVEGYHEHVFNILTDFGYPDAPKDSDKKWDGLKKKLNGYGPLEEKEELFVNSMLDALSEGAVDRLVGLFNTADNSGAKEYKVSNFKHGRQLIGFLEAESPGASREVLSYIVSQEATKARSDFIDSLGVGFMPYGEQAKLIRESYPDIDNKIMTDIVDKYAPYLSEVDKESYAKASLFYLQDKYPKYQDLLGEKDEVWKYVKLSSKMQKTFELDMFTKMSVESGDYDAFAFANAMSTIFMPGRQNVSKDGELDPDLATEYFKHTRFSAKDAIEYIRGQPITEDQQSIAIQGIIHGLTTITKDVLKDPILLENVGEEIQELKSYTYGSNKAVDSLGEEMLEHEGFQKVLGDGGSIDVSSLMDTYSSAGGYTNSKFSNGGYTNYNKYNKVYSSNKTFYTNFRSLNFDVTKSQLFTNTQYGLNNKKVVYAPKEWEMLKWVARRSPTVTYKSKYSKNATKKRGGNVFTLKQPKAPKFKSTDRSSVGDTIVRIGRVGPKAGSGSVKLPKGIFSKYSTLG